MKVSVSQYFREPRIMNLDDVLEPTLDPYEAEGEVERARALARKTAGAFGRLAAALVEKDIITLEEAVAISGISDTVERIP